MVEMMEFPDTVEEFMEQHKTVDTEQIYSNGIEFVPIFRMNQWFEHCDRVKKKEENAPWTLADISPENSGVYLCRITNMVGKDPAWSTYMTCTYDIATDMWVLDNPNIRGEVIAWMEIPEIVAVR